MSLQFSGSLGLRVDAGGAIVEERRRSRKQRYDRVRCMSPSLVRDAIRRPKVAAANYRIAESHELLFGVWINRRD